MLCECAINVSAYSTGIGLCEGIGLIKGWPTILKPKKGAPKVGYLENLPNLLVYLSSCC